MYDASHCSPPKFASRRPRQESREMASASPHVSLAGFAYLEPLARPLARSSSVLPTVMPVCQPLSPKLRSLTERLSPESNWMTRIPEPLGGTSRAGCLSPKLKPNPLHCDGICSDFARSGVWPVNRRRSPTTPRPRGLTAQMRRELDTNEWHTPPRSPRSTRIDFPEILRGLS